MDNFGALNIHLLNAMMRSAGENATQAGTEVVQSSIVSATSAFGIFLSIVPPIATILVQLSPVPTVYSFVKDKTTKELSVAPYLAMGIASATWALYGTFIKDYSLIAPNVFGTFLAAIFTILFHCYCPQERRKQIYMYYVSVVAVVLAVAFVCYHFREDAEQQIQVMGSMALGSYFIFLFSPFSVLFQVINTKSVESLPFELSFFICLNSSLWVLYAVLVSQDVSLAISSACGVIIAGAQLACHLIYGNFLQSLKILVFGCCFKTNVVPLNPMNRAHAKAGARKLETQSSAEYSSTSSDTDLEAATQVSGEPIQPILAAQPIMLA